MKKLDINDIKRLSFEVLCSVRDVCEQNDISYSLTGGTLIGAVRHGGFIPWDDDIDIMMPRPDYDRFIRIVKDGAFDFDLLSYETCGDDYWYPFAKVCHKKTLVKENAIRESNLKMGVYVDIYPVDGAGDRYLIAKIRTMAFQFLHGLKVTSNWTSYHRSKLRKWYYEPFRYVCYLISKLLGRKQINKYIDCFLRAKDYSKCKYAGRLVGDYGSREIMMKDLFESRIKVTFENESFDAVSDYDTFLTKLYGNYMNLPPIEKRVTHHEFEAYWLE